MNTHFLSQLQWLIVPTGNILAICPTFWACCSG